MPYQLPTFNHIKSKLDIDDDFWFLSIDDVGRSAAKALLTAFERHGYGAAYNATINLWGSRLATSLTKSYTQTFVSSFVSTAFYTPLSYGVSTIWSQLSNYFGWNF